jgi:hypothetical protein
VNFNIVNLNENVEMIFQAKKLVLTSICKLYIDLKFAQILDNNRAYQLYNFKIDSIQIKAWTIPIS